MSLTLHPIPVVAVYNPIDDLSEKVLYTVEKGAQNVTSYIFNSSNTSNTGTVFIANPPNTHTTMDRKVYVRSKIAVKFTGNAPTDGGNLLRAGYDAPRAFPLSSVISSCVASLNNTNINLATANVVHPLTRMNFDTYTRKCVNGGAPSGLDFYCDYSDGVSQGSSFVRNPLSGVGSSTNESDEKRGFDTTGKFSLVTGNENRWVKVVNNSPTEAEVEITVREPLWLAPFSSGKGEHKGFNNVQTFTINLTYISSLSRVWSHAQSSPASFTNVEVRMGAEFIQNGSAYDFNAVQPSLEVMYHTPSPLYKVPDLLQYDYYEIIRYATQGQNLASGAVQQQFKTNNIILNSVPNKVIIYAKRQDADLYAVNGYQYADSYCRLSQVNILFNNRSGILSQMSEYQLYQMSRKNGLNMSFSDWWITGSPLIMSPSSDWGMNNDSEANGVQGQYNLQIQSNVENQSSNALTFDFNIIVISEGVLTLEAGGRTISELACLSHKDVLDATSRPWMRWSELRKFGGSMYSSFRRNMPHAKLMKHGGAVSGGAVSGGAMSAGAMSAGAVSGGAKMHKKSLKHRLF
jgi:hypothetical protein